MNSRQRSFIVVLLFSVWCVALGWAEDDPSTQQIDRARKIMRQYVKDTTELPLNVSSTLEVFDISGRLIERTQNSHHFEIAAVRRDNGTTTLHASARKVHGKTLWQIFNVDIAAVMAGFILELSQQPATEFRSGADFVAFAFRPAENCTAFQLGLGGFQLAELCGEGELVSDMQSLSPMRWTFLASGLPIRSGNNILLKFRFEQEFQTISLSGDMLVIPKTARAEYQTERGLVVVKSRYTPRSQ